MKFLEGLERSCKTKTAEWEEPSGTRAGELVALADAIKVLNDDGALDLFRKTLPGAGSSWARSESVPPAMRGRALALIRDARRAASGRGHAGLGFLALARSGGAASRGTLGKVIEMIDEMVNTLKREQRADDDKKGHCAKELTRLMTRRKAWSARCPTRRAPSLPQRRESRPSPTR